MYLIKRLIMMCFVYQFSFSRIYSRLKVTGFVGICGFLLGACQDVAPSSSEQEQKEKTILLQSFESIVGTYEGNLEFSEGEIPFRLELFVGEQSVGFNDEGKEKFIPILRASLREVGDDARLGRGYEYFLSVRFDQELGELTMNSKENASSSVRGEGFFYFKGRIRSGVISGTVNNHRGVWGNLVLERVNTQYSHSGSFVGSLSNDYAKY